MRLFWHYFIPILFFVAKYFFDKKNGRAIPGASSSSTSTERSDSDQQQQNGRMLEPPEDIMLHQLTTSVRQHEDPGTYCGPSASVDVMEFDIAVNQQRQKKGRTIPCGTQEDDRASGSSTSAEGSDSGPSPSSTPVKGNNYYVFLSFRGLDTRNGFVDHLYHRLKDVGLTFHQDIVFRDDDKLSFGEDIGENLLSAIECSKVSIPVISEKYAASEWCLRELIHIMECKERRGQKVLPVLYNVKPSDVRYLKGAFGEALKSRRHPYEEAFKQRGTKALRKAVACRIFESVEFAQGREGKLVNKLVEIITCKLQHDFPPPLPTDLVGIDDHVTEVMRLANTAPSKIRTIVIYGVGGSGKTTLAKIIYKNLFNEFDRRSFLKDTRETIKRKGIEHVQSILISDITKSYASSVHDSVTGIRMIQISCDKKKVLILLDDVDCQDHLDKLIGDCKFEPGSRIIITCRDKALLKSEYEGYELKEMNHEDSLHLFNRYAFEKKQPSRELAALSGDIVATAKGLPLALMTLGSLLKGKGESLWIEMLKKLRKVPNRDVQKMLRISYDSLGYEEQQMFLDIACFFIGINKRIATYLWEDLNLCLDSGFDRMIELLLIKYDDDENELIMHDQLRDLGRVIARPANEKPWKCSRLWDEEAIAVQQSKEENRDIEALRLDKEGSIKFMERESFRRMPNLKFLHLSEVDFVGDFGDSLTELRWLEWEMCPDSINATNIYLEKLLVLNLSGGFISENWEGWSSIKMERLKVLNLSGCSNLKSTPNLSAFKSLEMLILENCENLEKFHPSIGDVKCLVSLNLRYCGSLKELPEQLGRLEKLEELFVNETDIKEIPQSIGSLKKLKTLSAVGCRLLTQLPSSISGLVSLLTLNLNTCKKLQKLPDSIEALGELRRLSLERCYMLKEIPASIGKLRKLVELDLSSTGIKGLPESIGELKKLKFLRICHSKIEELPRAIGKLKSLQELDASGCQKLKGKILLDRGGLSSLSTLRLGSTKISGLPEDSNEAPTLKLHELSNLNHLDLLYCSELQSLPKPPSSLSSLQLTCQSKKLPSLAHLDLLKELTLRSCMSLESIPELPSYIQKLRVWKCPKLKMLPKLSKLKYLSELELLQCYGLQKLDGLGALRSLRKLDVSTSTELSNLEDFEDLESLRYSDMQSDDGKADRLDVMRGLGQSKSLEVLNISARKRIEQLDLSSSKDLKELIVNNCERLDTINFHKSIKSLERFDTDGCKSHIPRLLPRDRR